MDIDNEEYNDNIPMEYNSMLGQTEFFEIVEELKIRRVS